MSTSDRLPLARGFDSSFGYLSGAEDHFKQTRAGFVDFWRDVEPARGENGTAYGAYQYTAEALRIIRAQGERERRRVAVSGDGGEQGDVGSEGGEGRPMFMYLAYQIMHGPNQAPDNYTNLWPSTMYAPRRLCNAMMSACDDSIGTSKSL